MKAFLDHDELVDTVLATTTTAILEPTDWSTLEDRIQETVTLGLEAPLTWLRLRLGLSVSEERVVWTLLAHELLPQARTALRAINTEETSDVSLDTIRRVVYGGASKLRAWRELGVTSKLRKEALIERTDGVGDVPEYRQTFKVSRRVLALAHGDVSLDSDISGIAAISVSTAPVESLSVAATTLSALTVAIRSSGDKAVIVAGKRGMGRRTILSAVAKKALQRESLVVDCQKLSKDRVQLRHQLAKIGREARLLELVPIFTSLDALCAGECADGIEVLESSVGGLVLGTTTEHIARRWQRPTIQVEIEPLGRKACMELWRKALSANESDGEVLANLYPLTPGMIAAAGAAARAIAADGSMTPDTVQAGIRSVLEHGLSQTARRVVVTQNWSDLVLAEDQGATLTELIARVRARDRVYEDWGFGKKVGRGLGIAALFSGPPGTGKTMVAGLIARELRLELYQVDMSKISSKWIGETEKNLAALFDAAEAGRAVLLFDEADALFGKRSEVKSSNDKHANQEVNYLLQRLETFTGICILTSNHESNIDPAFQRRLSLHLRFQVPDEDEREKLWRAMLPAAAPVDNNVDFTGLARRFEMTGGYIRNAALRAAFLAADEGTSISDAHLEHAARLEYEGMGKIVAPRESSWPSRLSASL